MYFYDTYPTLHILDSLSAHEINKYAARHPSQLSPPPSFHAALIKKTKALLFGCQQLLWCNTVFDSNLLYK